MIPTESPPGADPHPANSHQSRPRDAPNGGAWIAKAARGRRQHALHRQWRTVDPDQLDDAAAELCLDERLRAMPPVKAVSEWLKPLSSLKSLADMRVGAHRAPSDERP